MNSKNMTECEMYLTLVMRHLKANYDWMAGIRPIEQVKFFTDVYCDPGSPGWYNFGHPSKVDYICDGNCSVCWHKHIKEFIENGFDCCNL